MQKTHANAICTQWTRGQRENLWKSHEFPSLIPLKMPQNWCLCLVLMAKHQAYKLMFKGCPFWGCKAENGTADIKFCKFGTASSNFEKMSSFYNLELRSFRFLIGEEEEGESWKFLWFKGVQTRLLWGAVHHVHLPRYPAKETLITRRKLLFSVVWQPAI